MILINYENLLRAKLTDQYFPAELEYSLNTVIKAFVDTDRFKNYRVNLINCLNIDHQTK